MRKSLLKRFGTIFFLLSVVPLLVSGGFILFRTLSSEKEHAFLLQAQKADGVSQQVENYIGRAEEKVRDLARVLSYHGADSEKQKRYMRLFESSDYSNLTLTDGQGREILRDSYYTVVGESDLKSLSESPAFIFPRNRRDVYFSGITAHPVTREPLMTISIPVIDPVEGIFMGVLKAEVRLKKVWKQFEEFSGVEGHLVYLVDGGGKIIAHPVSSVVLKGTLTEFIEGRGTGKSYHGEKVLYARKDIVLRDKKFGVIVETPVNEALASAYDTFRVLTFAIAACLGLSFIFLLYSRRSIIIPLKTLFSAVNRLKEGDLDQQVKVVTEDEIGMLTQSFNETASILSSELAVRRKAEDLLRESEERYRVLFNAGNDAVFVHGFEENGMPSRFVEVNDVACRRLGYTREELMKLTPLDIDSPEMRDRMPETMESIHEKKNLLFEIVHLAKDGRKIPVEISGREFTFNDWKFMLSIARDITERKEAEEALVQSHEMFNTVLDSQAALVYVTDMESYEILFINRYGRDIFGDITGKTCWKTLQKGQTEPCDFCSNKYLLDDEGRPTGVHFTELQNTFDGRWYELRDRAIKWIDGRTVRITVAMDISEKKELEVQLQQSQKMEAIGTLTGGIAHDFNNILTAIIGYGEVLQFELEKDSPLKEYVEQISLAADRAASLTQSLLTFSRKQVARPMPVDLNQIVENSRGLLSRIITEDVQLEIAPSEVPLIIMADSGQVGQILMNLCSNAGDAMPSGGALHIHTDTVDLGPEFLSSHGGGEPGMYALLMVSDTGQGMSRETKEKIFEPFFTTKDPGRGTGLGLSVVYGIVKQHQGFIEIESEPSEGTTFRIYLPLLPMLNKEEQKAPEITAPRGGTEAILIAEDSAQIRKLMEFSLEKAGYRVITASDGAEAILKYREHRESVKLVILDIVMPKVDGKRAFDEIRSVSPDVQVIFISGYGAHIIQDKGMLSGDVSYLTKPISQQELLVKVREKLDGCEARS